MKTSNCSKSAIFRLSSNPRQRPGRRWQRWLFAPAVAALFFANQASAIVIQAEDYNAGGQNVGYYDTTPTSNAGGQYRTDGVDIKAHAVGGGYYVTSTIAEEWLAFDVVIPTAGNYDLTLRVASTSLNRRMHLSINGVNVSGTMQFNGLGAGQGTTFFNVQKLFPLTSGTHTIKVHWDSGNINFDYFELVHNPNVAPTVNAGPDATLTYPASNLTLSGTYTDDGYPNPPAAVTTKWTQLSGPSHVTISDPTSLTTNISVNGYNGTYVLRLTANDGLFESHDDVTITKNDTTRVALPERLQAEDYRVGGPGFAFADTTTGNAGGQHRPEDVDIDTCSEGGYAVTGIAAGEWISFDVVVPASGYYTLTARVGSALADRQLHFQTGEIDISGPVTFGNTGGDETYVDASAGAFLEKGRHTLKVCMDTAGFHLNYVDIQPQTFAANIVTSGTGNAEIITGTAPTRSATVAAQELQTYVQKISGATLPILTAPASATVKIYVGKSAYTDALSITNTDLPNGAFRMISGTNSLVLLGKEADFVPIAPYATSATNRPTALAYWDALTGNKWGNPYQSVFGGYNNELNLWCDDERGTLNAVYQFLRNLGVRWYFPGTVGEVYPTATTIGLPAINLTARPVFGLRQFSQPSNRFKATDEHEPLWQLRLGSNDGTETSPFPWTHSIQYLLERDELKALRPEHYAEYDGVPATTACMGVGAPRLSSSGLFSDNLDFIRLLFDHYEEPNVGVMPPDGFTRISDTEPDISFHAPEQGEDGRMSDYVFDYVNRIAAAIEISHPGKMITAGAYSRYRLPPANIEALRPNVQLTLVRSPNFLVDHEVTALYRKMTDDWLAMLPSHQLYLWDKYRHAVPDDENNLYKGVPTYFPHLLADDFQYMRTRSIGYFTEIYRAPAAEEAVWHPLASNHLNMYAASMLYWNPDLDVDAMLEEYYTKFYGPAAAEMKSFVEYCEANWKNVPTDSGIIPAMKSKIDLALTAAGTGNVYKDRIQIIRDFLYLQNP